MNVRDYQTLRFVSKHRTNAANGQQFNIHLEEVIHEQKTQLLKCEKADQDH